MTEQKEESSASTSYWKEYETVVFKGSPSIQQLHGLLELKGYEKIPLESISDFLNSVEKFTSTLKAASSVMFKRGSKRVFWRLHKKTPTYFIIIHFAPTNNNTHTHVTDTVTS